MGRMNVYYRAFKSYRQETVENASCERDRRMIAQSDKEHDKLEATKYLCNIHEDWIQTIEEGLTYVEKAVQEERQFIRTNGEVVPIEKVKKISKDTVEHLAKHSDLITHLPEDGSDDIIPDKLYMVEKLSDYAVYENRFLYMLLCYLRDFINFRLEKIEALRHTYVGNFEIDKKVIHKKRTLTIHTTILDERENNQYPIADEKSAGLLQRIKDCQQIVNSLLNTDLMMQVAKSPMIKPPIVKTNVLKMNNNFKRALALYDYVATFKDLGFTYEEVKYNFAPFTDKVADEIAEAANLTSFIAYKYGNGIDDILERAYKEEEQRRKEEEAQKLVERIKRLKKRALESNKTLEEYMLLLETRVRQLEKDSETLQVIRQEMDILNHRIEELTLEKTELNRRVDELQTAVAEKEREIAFLNQKYIEDMAAVRQEHELHVAELAQAHADELDALNAEHGAAVAQLQVQFAEQMQQTIDSYEANAAALQTELADLNAQYAGAMQAYAQAQADIEARAAGFEDEQRQLADSYESKLRAMETDYRNEFALRDKAAADTIAEWEKENLYIRTELDGLRVKHGLMTPSTDYSSRERFTELESEFEAFKRFFKDQWKITKKVIRQEVFAAQNNKPGGEAEQDGE